MYSYNRLGRATPRAIFKKNWLIFFDFFRVARPFSIFLNYKNRGPLLKLTSLAPACLLAVAALLTWLLQASHEWQSVILLLN